ncbi:hypothetical protein GF325_12245 [Candidatus Bathyarchaeota archaeon]|nr:hypothetical protein [Candidatus Bathyarchaeota archaeon]
MVCESCGLALTRKEMEELRSKLRKQMDLYNDEKQQDTKYRRKKRRNKEYLDWWTSEHED